MQGGPFKLKYFNINRKGLTEKQTHIELSWKIIHVRQNIYIYTHIYVHIYITHTHIHTYLCVCICICIHINVYKHRYIHIVVCWKLFNNWLPSPPKKTSSNF